MGRVCLFGDAAFVARPHAAGTAKAVEEGWQLVQALQATQGDVVQALQRGEPRQPALGEAVLTRTRAAGQRAQVENSGEWVPPCPLTCMPRGIVSCCEQYRLLTGCASRPLGFWKP